MSTPALLFTMALSASVAQKFQTLATTPATQVGICAMNLQDKEPACVHGQDAFPLQSVMKLIVAGAVMEAVDQKQLQLQDRITVTPADASPGPQEFADLVKKQGTYKASIEELIRRSIVDSDSTSVDLLIEKIGGLAAVQKFLEQKKITGIRIDRNERTLQSEFHGLVWQPAYADEKKFNAARDALPAAKREQAWNAYMKDPRDTATPTGMVQFLKKLATGQLLSPESTQKLLAIMESTATGVHRLKAGTPASWKLAHKTGTSAEWQGKGAAINDVGILTAPDSTRFAIAVFVAGSRQPMPEREKVIAQAAAAVTAAKP